MSVTWTNEMEMQFLEYYQSEPILWDPKLKDHKNKLKIHDAWMRIGVIMEIPVANLKKKRDSLLSSYRSYKTKVKKSLSSEASTDEIYKPVWFAYELMDAFLSGTTKCNKTINTETQLADHLDEVSDALSEDDLIGRQESKVANADDNQNANTESNVVQTFRRRRNPTELLAAVKVVKEALDTFATTLKRVNADKETIKEADDCNLYAQLLAKKLRKIPEEKRLQLMHDIDGMILRHQYGYQSQTCFSPARSSPSPSHFSNSLNQFQRPGTSASSYSNSAVYYTMNNTIKQPKRSPSTVSLSQSLPKSHNYTAIVIQEDNSNDVRPRIVIQSNEQVYPPVIHLQDNDEYIEELTMSETNIIERAFNVS